MEIDFARPVTEEAINISTGFGNATVFVPSNTQAIAAFDAVSGILRNEATTGDQGRMRITMEATTGNLTVAQAPF